MTGYVSEALPSLRLSDPGCIMTTVAVCIGWKKQIARFKLNNF